MNAVHKEKVRMEGYNVSADKKITAVRVILGLALLLALITALFFAYDSNSGVEVEKTPQHTTTEAEPDSTQISPGEGNNSVQQGGDESDPTTPSSSGTGANTMLAPDVPPN